MGDFVASQWNGTLQENDEQPMLPLEPSLDGRTAPGHSDSFARRVFNILVRAVHGWRNVFEGLRMPA